MDSVNSMLFTPGPVNVDPRILLESSKDQPYFRNNAFSGWLLNLESQMLEILGLSNQYRVLFISGSGTSAMEMALRSVGVSENLLSVETGLFSQRATSISRNLGLNVTSLPLDLRSLEPGYVDRLIHESLESDHFSAVHYTYSETSNGALISPNIKSLNGGVQALVVVDAVTALFTEKMNLADMDIIYSASQKGIGCHPGVGFLIVSPFAQEIILSNPDSNLYLHPKKYLIDNKRGQTPYTPSLSVLSQMHSALSILENEGGYDFRVKTVSDRAKKFRSFLSAFGVEPDFVRQANCVTNFLPPENILAKDLVTELASQSIYIAPNPPEMYPNNVRVAHFGFQTENSEVSLLLKLKEIFGRQNA